MNRPHSLRPALVGVALAAFFVSGCALWPASFGGGPAPAWE